MKCTLTDKDIKAKAQAHQWDVFAFSVSGKVRRVGLVFDRDGYEDVDFRVIESGDDADQHGRNIAERWQRLKRAEEEDLIYLRAVELGEPYGQHVLVRMATSGDTEMFRCQKCNRLVPGRVDFQQTSGAPYCVIAPSLGEATLRQFKSESGFNRTAYKDWTKFWRPCTKDQTKHRGA